MLHLYINIRIQELGILGEQLPRHRPPFGQGQDDETTLFTICFHFYASRCATVDRSFHIALTLTGDITRPAGCRYNKYGSQSQTKTYLSLNKLLSVE